jgi:hypothetical protein
MTISSKAWRAVPGVATKALLSIVEETQHLGSSELERVQSEAVEVISMGGNPLSRKCSTGLVIGYVQSGKTLSLTVVSTLAKDNGYGLVIVLAGVTNKLFDQNAARLERDLGDRLSERSGRVVFSKTRKPGASEIDRIASTIDEWLGTTDTRPIPLCMTIKYHSRIEELADALSKVGPERLSKVPVLIIDDEAHMAGLNTKFKEGEESEVYGAIKHLRSVLPNHLYLQYTATPQAPLLVQIADSVSPQFCQILTPGSNYVGGKQFFTPPLNSDLIVEIDDLEEKPATPKGRGKGSVVQLEGPPQSLRDAILDFLIGVSDGFAKGEHLMPRKRRSMLVHPHFRIKTQARYRAFVKHILIDYEERLSLPLARAEFEKTILQRYGLFSKTYPEISTFQEVFRNFLNSIRAARGGIRIINSKNPDSVNWDGYAHILIGGEVLGVGFTVEGLTVTYMPRANDRGQMDSMQQRARFFGYHRSYLGLCRVYITQGSRDAYSSYVIHEEHVRETLDAGMKAGKKLQDMRRDFLAYPGMQLTRKNIQSLETLVHDLPALIYPRTPWLVPDGFHAKHRALFESLSSKYGFNLDSESVGKTEKSYRHYSCDVPVADLSDVLIGFSWGNPLDSARWTSAIWLLKVLEGEAKIGSSFKLTKMRPEMESGNSNRTISDKDWGLMQSSSKNYKGDKFYLDHARITIQLYSFDFNDEVGAKTYKGVIVPCIAPSDRIRKLLSRITQPD